MRTRKNNSDRNAVRACFGLRGSARPRVAKILDEFILLQGTMEHREVIQQLLPTILQLDRSEIERVFESARAYPEYYQFTKETMQKMMNRLKEVLSHE